MICQVCYGVGKYNTPVKTCFRCGGSGQVHDGWIEPDLPDINRIRELAREKGYAVGVHGSEKRDYDIIAAPWTNEAVECSELVTHLCEHLPARMVGDHTNKPLGRTAFTLQLTDGYYRPIDLSVMPMIKGRL